MTRNYPYGYRSAAPGWPAEMLTADQLMSKAPWARLHPEVRRRHLAIFDAAQDAGTMLGIGGGWRSAAQQEATFRARYDTTPRPNAKSKVTWNGQVWYIKSNNLAPSTPPGRSWHEESPEVIDNMTEAWAYAVDTTGDWAFLKANCAQFGLVEFSEVNDEPWHTQPVELPIARRNYAGQVLRVFPLPGLPVDPAPLPEPQPEPIPGDTDMASSILCLEDANPPHAYYRCDGVTKVWINTQDAKLQIDKRIAESQGGTRPAVDGFVYHYMKHGGVDVIASYGPIVGPVPDGHDIYGRH